MTIINSNIEMNMLENFGGSHSKTETWFENAGSTFRVRFCCSMCHNTKVRSISKGKYCGRFDHTVYIGSPILTSEALSFIRECENNYCSDECHATIDPIWGNQQKEAEKRSQKFQQNLDIYTFLIVFVVFISLLFTVKCN